MNRALPVLSLLALVGAYVLKPGTPPERLVVRSRPGYVTLDSNTGSASVSVLVGNRDLPQVILTQCNRHPHVVLEHRVAGAWFTHSPIVATCRGAAKLLRAHLQPGDSVTTWLVVRQPGKYRARVYYAPSLQDTITSIVSPEFTVARGRLTRV